MTMSSRETLIDVDEVCFLRYFTYTVLSGDIVQIIWR